MKFAVAVTLLLHAIDRIDGSEFGTLFVSSSALLVASSDDFRYARLILLAFFKLQRALTPPVLTEEQAVFQVPLHPAPLIMSVHLFLIVTELEPSHNRTATLSTQASVLRALTVEQTHLRGAIR